MTTSAQTAARDAGQPAFQPASRPAQSADAAWIASPPAQPAPLSPKMAARARLVSTAVNCDGY